VSLYIPIVSKHKVNGEYEYELVFEDIDEYDVTQLEDAIVDKIKSEKDCEILFECVDGSFVNAQNDKIFYLANRKQLSGFVKVYENQENKDRDLHGNVLHKKKCIIEAIQQKEISVNDTGNIFYIATGRTFNTDTLRYQEERGLAKICEELEFSMSSMNEESIDDLYNTVQIMKGNRVPSYAEKQIGEYSTLSYNALNEMEKGGATMAEEIIGITEAAELPELKSIAEVIVGNVDVEELNEDDGAKIISTIGEMIGKMSQVDLKRVYAKLKERGLI